MRFNFTTRQLLLFITVISVALAIGVYMTKSTIFTIFVMYASTYGILFLIVALVRFRSQLKAFREQWNQSEFEE